MFRSLLKKLNFMQIISQNPQNQSSYSETSQSPISTNLKSNLDTLRNILGKSNDIIMREFTIGSTGTIKAGLLYVDGLTDHKTINESIMQPLMYDTRIANLNANSFQEVQTNLVSVGDVKQANTIEDIVMGCLSGDTILLINGAKQALVISSRGWESRSVQEPKTEAVVRGPREGFTETLRSNTSLLRRKIRNPNLTLDTIRIGKRTQTDVSIAYIKGITNPRLVEEIKRRLKRINTDAILESGYIEEFIEDAPFSPFSTVANSEKPDTVAAKILEGRAAIFVDGTPFVLTVPMLFVESFQSAEDYYSRPFYTSMIRNLRFLAFLISVLGPATYVALTTFHQELIPTPLLLTMAAAKEGTPFPAFLEAVGMGIVFEILREAGVRLPRPVGQAISIVGALVIGEAAVSAGLIGAPMVIVVAITAISSFMVPAHSDVGTIIRFIVTTMAGILGAFGIVLALLGVLIHLTSLRSFGAPYLSPLAPFSPRDLKDVFVRVPLWAMFTRPRTIGWHDPQRQEFRLMPEPPSEKELKKR